jgi:hypothetical protein
MADPGLAPSMQALQALHKKFDVANAALGKLHIGAGWFYAALLVEAQFLVNARPRLGNCFDSVEIGSSPVDQRLDKFEKFASGPPVSGRDACFDQHLQFPVASASSVVVFRAFEGVANFAESSVGAQPQINPITSALLGVRGEHIGHAVGGCSEKFPGHRTVAGMDKHQVDVGAVIEFTASQLTERDDGKLRTRGRPVLACKLIPDRVPCRIENGVGKV